jgi:hypothetical protein
LTVYPLKVLDLFSGLGGWSEAFKKRGHEVLTLDFEPKFKPNICADLLKVTPKQLRVFGPFDIILASPPCTEFSKASLPKSWASVQRFGCNPDTKLLVKTVELIQALKPKWWVIENVRGAVPYFKPILGNPVRHIGSRYLWGEFPMFDSAPKYGKWKLPKTSDRAAKRSLIPYSLSLALCLSCEWNMPLITSEIKEKKA